MISSEPAAETPEQQLLLACTRVEREGAESAAPAVPPRLAWESFLSLARRHYLLPLAADALAGSPLSQGQRESLQAEACAIGLLNLARAAELLRLLRLFEADGLRVLTYKGPVLAAALYGNLARRPFDDLDLLVAPEHFDRARMILLDHGYRSSDNWDATQEELRLRAIGQLEFRHPRTGVLVDLHAAAMPGYLRFPLTFAGLWRRRVRQQLAGMSVQTLAPEDLLLLLCVHGGKHLWHRLAWLVDVARLVSRLPLDARRVRLEAGRLGCRRRLWLGLLLARELLGAALPAGLAPPAGLAGKLQRPLAEVRHRLWAAPRLPTPLQSCRWHLQVCDSLNDGLRYSLGVIFQPSPLDTWGASLSPRQRWLYFLWRPIRLAGKYARRRRPRTS
jgi:hypothetical protein